jgi:hypothetical protein
MFLQIDKRHTPLPALHLFFPTLPIIWAQVAAKRFLRNSRWWPCKIKKECPAPQHHSNTCRLIPISTHLSFRWTIPLMGQCFCCALIGKHYTEVCNASLIDKVHAEIDKHSLEKLL